MIMSYIPCPICKKSAPIVKTLNYENWIERYRKCKDCGFDFRTVELYFNPQTLTDLIFGTIGEITDRHFLKVLRGLRGKKV